MPPHRTSAPLFFPQEIGETKKDNPNLYNNQELKGMDDQSNKSGLFNQPFLWPDQWTTGKVSITQVEPAEHHHQTHQKLSNPTPRYNSFHVYSPALHRANCSPRHAHYSYS